MTVGVLAVVVLLLVALYLLMKRLKEPFLQWKERRALRQQDRPRGDEELGIMASLDEGFLDDEVFDAIDDIELDDEQLQQLKLLSDMDLAALEAEIGEAESQGDETERRPHRTNEFQQLAETEEEDALEHNVSIQVEERIDVSDGRESSQLSTHEENARDSEEKHEELEEHDSERLGLLN
ncbi:MAG: hypothetical protein MHM6MM_004179 [Cercozoa sp. M6MM]